MNIAWSDIGKVLVLLATLGVCGGLFTYGKELGEKGREERENALRAEYERQLAAAERAAAAKDEEVRRCERANAQLQAFANLAEKDQDRILAATAIIPPLAITFDDGRPFRGRSGVPVRAKNGATFGAPSCVNFSVRLENTGARDILFTGHEFVPTEKSSVRATIASVRALILSPGAREMLRVTLCKEPGSVMVEGKRRPNPVALGDRFEGELRLYARGFLPHRTRIELVAEQ